MSPAANSVAWRAAAGRSPRAAEIAARPTDMNSQPAGLIRAAPGTNERIKREGSDMVDVKVVAEGLRFPEGPVVLEDGTIAVVEIARGTGTRVGPDGRTFG